MFSDVASIGLGAIIMVIIAALLAKQTAAGWLRGNSWGGAAPPVVVETRPRRHYQPVWSIGEVCDRNMRAGYFSLWSVVDDKTTAGKRLENGLHHGGGIQ